MATPPPKLDANTALPLTLFDYELPKEAIAQHPAEPRDASRLMVLQGDLPVAHHGFVDLPSLLAPGDLLVVNHTQVMPARLRVRKATGGEVELLLHTPCNGAHDEARTYKALARPAKGLTQGKVLTTAGGVQLEVLGREGDSVLVRAPEAMLQVMLEEGTLPLPPYLADAAKPSAQDAASYQTIFGSAPGAVAAPTASLHFTERTMAALQARGVNTAQVLLHVGPGTFLPVRPEHADDVRGHGMHGEWYAIPEETQGAVRATRAAGGRIVAVGTTSLRALETWATSGAPTGISTLFVTPGYTFACVTDLVTNFHVPKSTLLMLVSAMAGRQRVLSAYEEAKACGYRFFSFGDAMLILDAVAKRPHIG